MNVPPSSWALAFAVAAVLWALLVFAGLWLVTL